MKNINALYNKFHTTNDHNIQDVLTFYEKNHLFIQNITDFVKPKAFDCYLNLMLWFAYAFYDSGRFKDCIALYRNFADIGHRFINKFYSDTQYPDEYQRILLYAAYSYQYLKKTYVAMKIYKELSSIDAKNMKYKIGIKNCILGILSRIDNIIWILFFLSFLPGFIITKSFTFTSTLFPLKVTLLSTGIILSIFSFVYGKMQLK
jgi:hypothetical protein